MAKIRRQQYFFHKFASQRRKTNTIQFLENNDGNLLYDPVEIGNVAQIFFETLFTFNPGTVDFVYVHLRVVLHFRNSQSDVN